MLPQVTTRIIKNNRVLSFSLYCWLHVVTCGNMLKNVGNLLQNKRKWLQECPVYLLTHFFIQQRSYLFHEKHCFMGYMLVTC